VDADSTAIGTWAAYTGIGDAGGDTATIELGYDC